jgi:hypothetical protein
MLKHARISGWHYTLSVHVNILQISDLEIRALRALSFRHTVHDAWWITPGECPAESCPVELSAELLPERCQLFAGVESLAVRRRIAPRACEHAYAGRWEPRPREDGVAP